MQQLGRVGQQRVLVADHLELDPVGLERLACEPCGQHRVARREAPGGVGKQPHARLVEYPHLGHFGPFQDPDTLADDITAAFT